MTDPTARALIDRLALQPHPEGGWYRETWRAEAMPGERAGATAIYFLLEAGQRSHWHKVDASETWLWHAGHALSLSTAPGDEGPVTALRLGGDVLAGEIPQHVIAPYHWQAAEADRGWALVSCIVTPGFDFAGFTLAPPGWAPGCAPGDPSPA
ncbi:MULTISPECIES: cupin domain-containing protein [unclassified Sphingobium]|uniref:cupin domain-containing protein n=1 Tax=unclassified Sphingobium TaxID=2611147 RepID=UPI00222446FC|nr:MULTISPECIES: cupin domain-containing protein [unclassified Sphingobium]MCW2351427.1 putative cupin superfamily sugar epimerase [Sphingobium sp. B12D2B]MCW2370648.1 putative cupin superfamily sugar epimerase [Sphingobium sp. B11D3D]